MFSWVSRNRPERGPKQVNQDPPRDKFNYSFSSCADETAVQFSYLYLLGREAESDAAIRDALSSSRSIYELKRDTLASEEYSIVSKDHNFKFMLQQYLSCKSERLDETYIENSSFNDVILLQTADSDRYKDILYASAVFNKVYADKHNLIYRDYLGIKRGCYPHHAMYNRTHILREFIDRGYTGWVFYIDADAIVDRPEFDIRSHLLKLRAEKKCMSLHSVYQPHDNNYQWWDVNSGTFAIDLSSSRARLLVEAWSGIYRDLYTMNDYRLAKVWSDRFIIDDQNALWLVLKQFEMQPHVNLTTIQGEGGYAYQFGRDDSIAIGSDDDLKSRISRMMEYGKSVYSVGN